MNNITALSDLRQGEHCTIMSLEMLGSLRSRFMDLGFVPGSSAECLHISRHKNIAAYLVCGSVIAARRADAAKITVIKTVISS